MITDRAGQHGENQEYAAKAAGRLYRFGGLTIERNGWRWGANARGRGVMNHPTPVHALFALRRWLRQEVPPHHGEE